MAIMWLLGRTRHRWLRLHSFFCGKRVLSVAAAMKYRSLVKEGVILLLSKQDGRLLCKITMILPVYQKSLKNISEKSAQILRHSKGGRKSKIL